MSNWMLVACLSLAVAGPGCKKKTGYNTKHVLEEHEEGALLPEPAPAKIDPEAEAADLPQPAAAGIPEDEGSEPIDEQPVKPPQLSDEDYSAGTFDDVQLIRLFSDRFPELTRRQRILAYHLSRAVLAGRDITFDQLHRDALEIRQLVECVLRTGNLKDKELADALEDYHMLLGVNYGFYDRLTGRKFIPRFTFEQFSQVVGAAHASGADMGLDRDEPLEGMLARLKRVMFDPDYQPTLIKWGSRARDSIDGSYLNLYRNVRHLALKRFDEHYPSNSRLIAIDGRLVEEVYRAGDRRRRIAPGRYARELRRVLKRLADAVSSADRPTRMMLGDLIEHFQTGAPAAFDEALRKWQSELLEVEFLAGFLDRELDPRGVKGLWMGVVGIQDQADSARLDSLLRSIQELEDLMPWKDSIRKRFKNTLRASAVDLVSIAGRSAPICRLGFRLPPDRAFGERSASKLLLFVNAIEAHRRAVLTRVVATFLSGPSRARANTQLAEIAFARAALREVVGRELGRVSVQVSTWAPGELATIETLKAELVALWLLPNPKLRDLGLTSSRDVHLAGWEVAAAELAASEALAPEGLVEPVTLARRILARALLERDAGLVIQESEGGPILSMQDPERFRTAISDLLVRCSRILADADDKAARKLIRQYRGAGTWPHREAFAERARQAGLRPIVAWVLPKLKPLRGDRPGQFVDASISFNEDFERQLLRIARY